MWIMIRQTVPSVTSAWPLNSIKSFNNSITEIATSEPINLIFSPEKSIRFSKVTNRIYIDALGQDIVAGQYVVIEAYANLDPDVYPKIYNDRLLKKYVTALIKRQWGANMAKYDGVQLPGGITFKGAQIYAEAIAELREIENEFYLTHELPTDFMIG